MLQHGLFVFIKYTFCWFSVVTDHLWAVIKWLSCVCKKKFCVHKKVLNYKCMYTRQKTCTTVWYRCWVSVFSDLHCVSECVRVLIYMYCVGVLVLYMSIFFFLVVCCFSLTSCACVSAFIPVSGVCANGSTHSLLQPLHRSVVLHHSHPLIKKCVAGMLLLFFCPYTPPPHTPTYLLSILCWPMWF